MQTGKYYLLSATNQWYENPVYIIYNYQDNTSTCWHESLSSLIEDPTFFPTTREALPTEEEFRNSSKDTLLLFLPLDSPHSIKDQYPELFL